MVRSILEPKQNVEGHVMPRSRIGLMGMAALLGALACAPAFGTPTGQSLALRAAADAQNPIREAQYYWNGRDSCWYYYGFFGLIKSPRVCFRRGTSPRVGLSRRP